LIKHHLDNGQKQEVIIPRKTILELQHLLEDSEDPVVVSLASNQVKFNFGDVRTFVKACRR